jgi:type III pantothenate kinase
MLLAIDIGNTAIKFGIFEDDTLTSKFLIPTSREYDVDQLSRAVNDQLQGEFDHAIVSSVVPEINEAVSEYLSDLSGVRPVFVKTTDDFNLTFNYDIREAGTDRLLNSSAASDKYGVPCIVIGFGTATTVDVISRTREHLGGLIAPGPATTAKALRLVTSKLPEVEIAEPPNVISTTTITSIQSGIFYSQIGLVETAVHHMKAEIGADARTIATGGFAHLIAHKCRSVDVTDLDLTLGGLRMLYSRQAAGVQPSR